MLRTKKIFAHHDILVCRANNFEVIEKNSNGLLPAQSSFDPVGRLLERYWSSFGRNGFEKLKKCADIIRKWPTTSTSLEKSFGQISTHHKKQSGLIHCETLLNLHNSMGPRVHESFSRYMPCAKHQYGLTMAF